MTDQILEEASPFTFPRPVPPLNLPPNLYGRTFRSGRLSHILDPAVTSYCTDLCTATELLEAGLLRGTTIREYRYVISLLIYASEQRSAMVRTYKGSGNIAECIFQGAIVFVVYVFYMPIEMRNLIQLAVNRLRQSIERRGDPLLWPEIELDVLIWVLFMAALNPHQCEDAAWLMQLLRRIVDSKFKGTEWPTSWREGLRWRLVAYLWSEMRCSDSFLRTCDCIELSRVVVAG